jgi:hypothetical protein
MRAPFQAFPPELLAQIAQAAFRPPQAMGMQAPGMQAPSQQPAEMPGLGMGLQGLGAAAGPLADWLRAYKGDPMASASYGSPRPAIPAVVPGFGHGFGTRGGV